MAAITSFIDGNPATILGLLLLVLMLIVGETAGRLRRRMTAPGETLYAAAAAVSLLGLLVGFTFNVALNRYDERRDLVVEEAAAITMAWERSAFLPPGAREEVRNHLRRYVDARRNFFQRGQATDRQRRPDAAGRAVRQQLWDVALAVEAAGDKPLMLRAFLDALSRMDDAAANREAMAREHIPINVVVVLAIVSLVTAGCLGYAGATAGPAARRANGAFFFMVAITLVTVLDIDRPRTGLVNVSQQPMRDLEALLDAELPVPPLREKT